MLKCQMSPVNGVLIGAAIFVFPTNDSGTVWILAKRGEGNRDGRLLSAMTDNMAGLCQAQILREKKHCEM